MKSLELFSTHKLPLSVASLSGGHVFTSGES